ncbi:hypothetical protein ACFOVU_04820 [Nocardiopsis sediminis]|uniref:Recombinase family protein n=1 Tax=Nocardiopsis sediminis TaxID=1778267 RepID=A0ABV8FKC4_9ACTN
MYFAYIRASTTDVRNPPELEPACREVPDEARRWSRRRAKRARLTCARCGLDFRRHTERDPAAVAFEVTGPDSLPRFECGGCQPDLLAALTAAVATLPESLPRQAPA